MVAGKASLEAPTPLQSLPHGFLCRVTIAKSQPVKQYDPEAAKKRASIMSTHARPQGDKHPLARVVDIAQVTLADSMISVKLKKRNWMIWLDDPEFPSDKLYAPATTAPPAAVITRSSTDFIRSMQEAVVIESKPREKDRSISMVQDILELKGLPSVIADEVLKRAFFSDLPSFLYTEYGFLPSSYEDTKRIYNRNIDVFKQPKFRRPFYVQNQTNFIRDGINFISTPHVELYIDSEEWELHGEEDIIKLLPNKRARIYYNGKNGWYWMKVAVKEVKTKWSSNGVLSFTLRTHDGYWLSSQKMGAIELHLH